MADDMLLLLLSDELSLSPRAVDWLDAAAAVGVGWWQPPFSDDELGLGFLLPEPASAPRPEALAPPAPGEHGDAAAAAPRQHEGVAWSAELQTVREFELSDEERRYKRSLLEYMRDAMEEDAEEEEEEEERLEEEDGVASAAPARGEAQTPPGPFEFEKLARGGGNMRSLKKSSREIEVCLNADGVALWEPRPSYAAQIAVLRDAIEALPSTCKIRGGIEHPLLHVHGVCMTVAMSDSMDRRIYGHRKPGNKAFAQLLSYLGMRSSIDKRANVRTLAFDPDGWNRTGYRLIKGGDVKGGKPTIAYRSNAARNLHNATSRIA